MNEGIGMLIFYVAILCLWCWLVWDTIKFKRSWKKRDFAHFSWVRAMNRDMIQKGIDIDEYEGIPADIAAQMKIDEVTK